ncbi:ATP-binding cassette, subfamily C (CFTR/MRP), member 12 [Sarotherodon galilaeus]
MIHDPNIDHFDTNICINVDQYECNELDTSVSVLLYALLQFHQRGNLAVCVNAAAFRCHRAAAVCFSSLVDSAPPRVSQRERRPPAYLTDYEVSTLPLEGQTQTMQPATASQYSHRGKTRSSQRSSSSRSTRASRSSIGRFPSHALSDLETAQLEERVKQMELEEFQQHLEEDQQVEYECQRLQAQAREAQQLQEEAIRTQESLTRQLERRRQLKKRVNELEIAKMVTSLLKEKAQEPSGSRVSPCPSEDSNSSTHAALPSVGPVGQPPVPLVAPPSTLTVIQPPAPVVAPPPVTKALHSLHSQCMPQVLHPTVPAGPRSTTFAPDTSYQASTPFSVQPSQYARAACTNPAEAKLSCTPARTKSELHQLPTVNAYPFLATGYGIPKPMIPSFESGRESDFALLKMALDNLLDSHPHLNEQYKYQVLLGHLRLPSAIQLAKAYMHDPTPYTTAMHALQGKYGQPRQLVQSELGTILNAPAIKFGDAEAFDAFALSVQSLVGMLRTLEGQNGFELRCGSHVDRLLSKMPPSYRDGFVEHCLNQGILRTGTDQTYTLPDLSSWLQMKSQAKRIAGRAASLYSPEAYKPTKKDQRLPNKPKEKSTTFFLTSRETPSSEGSSVRPKSSFRPKPYCPRCENKEHFLNACVEFKKLTTDQMVRWLTDEQRCWKCERTHQPEVCTLKQPCNTCREQHLTVLHDAVQQIQKSVLMMAAPTTTVYLDRPNRSPKVMLKVVKVLLYNRDPTLETHAILDDGSERIIILPQAVRRLNLTPEPETLTLRTVPQEVVQLRGDSVSFQVSSPYKPGEKYHIQKAFTADALGLSEHSYPVRILQRRYKHLRDLPLPLVDHVQPLLLIGSDMPHLLAPTEPVHLGPTGGPIAVHTKLGWSLQGPISIDQTPATEQQCLFTATVVPTSELFRNVERLWQIDTLPYVSEKQVTRSKQDQQALNLLQTSTIRVTVDGTQRYATPLLRRANSSMLQAPMEAVLPSLRSTERRLVKDPQRAEVYCQEIQKLEKLGYVAVVPHEIARTTAESWFIPHHMVRHNNNDRIVFNCSFQYEGKSLNSILLPGPALGPSLLGVLLRFRQYPVAVSGDIKGMFHQIRLLPADKPVMRFLWRDMKRNEEPKIYEWQVLPFGTTCSPCCAIYALQQHVRDTCRSNHDLVHCVEQSFYVDNCLRSSHSQEEAKVLVDSLRQLLQTRGFEIRQWASNIPAVIEHLPSNVRSESSDLWLSQSSTDLWEPTLGLTWDSLRDSFKYRHRMGERTEPTLRNVYKTLACQYDPLGYIVPFTTQAKILVQDLWKKLLQDER